MIRTALKAGGLVPSLVSMGEMLTSREAEGQPSMLERIPALMAALDAKARDLEAVQAAGSAGGAAHAAGSPPVAAPDARPTGARQVVVTPAPEGEPTLDAVPVHAGLPLGAAVVRVHRGLP
jgi:hypothetical protein